MAGPEYEVLAVRYATLEAHKSELYYRYGSYGEPDAEVTIDYFFWLLRRGGETILVDTGFDPAVGARRGRTCLCPPVEALARIGVEPESISTVILTHLHYDHTGNLDAFPAAQLVVQREELEFWSGPLAGRFQLGSHAEAADIALVVEAERAGRVRILDGSQEIADGIRAIRVGGHSPGQQLTVVSSALGDVVLASDAIHFYKELELDRPFAVIADLPEMYLAFDLLRELEATGSIVVAGHDPEVLERFPSLSPELAGLAVRIA
jgi:glyoxylase-like metal-dependent hydrolase (beta-lactamase superfamily II)